MLTIKTTKAPATWYVPEYGGNRDRPISEQIAVLIQPLTVAESNAAMDARLRRMKAGANVGQIAREARNAVVGSNVLSVEGVGDDAGNVCATGASLVETVLRAADADLDRLLDELYGAIVDSSRLSEGERKNS